MKSPSDLKTPSKASNLVVAGYSTVAVGLVAFLTINGASGIPSAATIGTAVLLVIGFLLPVAGMLGLRRSLETSKRGCKEWLCFAGDWIARPLDRGGARRSRVYTHGLPP